MATINETKIIPDLSCDDKIKKQLDKLFWIFVIIAIFVILCSTIYLSITPEMDFVNFGGLMK